MDCPVCGGSVAEESLVCDSCGTEFEEVDGPDPPPGEPLVTVLRITDPTLLPVVRSLLESEGIPCFVQHETMQDFLAWGRFWYGYNPLVGPMLLQVPASYVESALELLGGPSWLPTLEDADGTTGGP